jgi:hypothetical protein
MIRGVEPVVDRVGTGLHPNDALLVNGYGPG